VRTRLAAALAASVGLGIVSQGWGQEATTPNASGPTQEPNRLSIRNSVTPMSANQRIADAIADKLNHSPILSNFRVTVTVQDGDVELTGILWTDAQRAEVLRLTKSVAGVERVHDRMHVTVASNIVQTQASPPAAAPFQPIPLQGGQTPPPPALQFPPGLDVGRCRRCRPASGRRRLQAGSSSRCRSRAASRVSRRRSSRRRCPHTPGRRTLRTTTTLASPIRTFTRTNPSRSSARSTRSRGFRSAGGR